MVCMIQAADVHPDFLKFPRIDAADLRRVQEPCVIFQYHWLDSDGAKCWAYSVGGFLDGKPLGGFQGGVTIGGDVMIVHADTRGEADAIAAMGLQDTISALDAEEGAYIDAHAALARLNEVSPIRRMELATASPANRSDEFQEDTAAIRKLRGDDIVLTAGGVDEGRPH